MSACGQQPFAPKVTSAAAQGLPSVAPKGRRREIETTKMPAGPNDPTAKQKAPPAQSRKGRNAKTKNPPPLGEGFLLSFRCISQPPRQEVLRLLIHRQFQCPLHSAEICLSSIRFYPISAGDRPRKRPILQRFRGVCPQRFPSSHRHFHFASFTLRYFRRFS